MTYDPDMDYKWIEVKDGYKMYVPELRLNLYVMNSAKGWVGIAKFLYDEENKQYNTKAYPNMETAQSKLVNNLVAGLCNCQLNIMASIAKDS
jgi:hypothetical protein